MDLTGFTILVAATSIFLSAALAKSGATNYCAEKLGAYRAPLS
jgi:hypothetical protein